MDLNELSRLRDSLRQAWTLKQVEGVTLKAGLHLMHESIIDAQDDPYQLLHLATATEFEGGEWAPDSKRSLSVFEALQELESR